MYKKDFALKNQQWLVCHKTKPNQTKPNLKSNGELLVEFFFFKSRTGLLGYTLNFKKSTFIKTQNRAKLFIYKQEVDKELLGL